MKIIKLKKGREESLKRFHPWIFSGAIDNLNFDSIEEGSIIEVVDSKGSFLAYGHFQKGSIAVRVLSFEKSEGSMIISGTFWSDRISKALKVRQSVGIISEDTNAYRLVHGEGDNLPGLILDFYNGTVVLQAHSIGMYLAINDITNALKDVYGDALKAVYNKSSATAPQKKSLNIQNGFVYRTPSERTEITETTNAAESIVKENGIQFKVDWEGGQKTGFFLDQRENRDLLRRFSEGKRVLNLFCYTGGFSMYSLKGGAKSVVSVDSSAPALKTLEENMAINKLPAKGQTAESLCVDAISYLQGVEQDTFDLMIVDPPAFAKHRDALNNALKAYKRLNAEAISKVSKGGIIFTFSCSQVVDSKSFALAIFSAATQAERKVRILHRLTQPADHPVNIYHPEGEYLKGLVLYVE